MDNKDYKIIREKLAKTRLYFIIYIELNILLTGINLIISPHRGWFYWGIILGGVGIIIYWIYFFSAGRRLERELIEEKISKVMGSRGDSDREINDI